MVNVLIEARWQLLDGVANTLIIYLSSSFVALVLGLIFGLMLGSRVLLLRTCARVFVETFRGVPLLVQLFWFFYVLPYFGVELSPITTAVIAFGLCNGAYVAVIVNAAVVSVPRSQVEAGISLNYSPTQRVWRIILPEAVPEMLPPLGNLAIELLKATALVSLITVQDLTYKAVSLQQTTMHALPPFFVVLIGYFVIALCTTGLVRLLERSINIGLDRGGIH